jgi:hypothetical protein
MRKIAKILLAYLEALNQGEPEVQIGWPDPRPPVSFEQCE